MPRHNIFERRPFHQKNYGYKYDPRTFTLSVPTESAEARDSRMKGDLFEYALRSHTGVTHETIHWAQQHTTTIGFVTSLLRNAHTDLIIKSIASFPQRDRDRLFGMRMQSEALPIFRLCPRTGDPIVNAPKDTEGLEELAGVATVMGRVIAIFEKPLKAQRNWGMRSSVIPATVNYAYKRAGGPQKLPSTISMEGSGPCIYQNQEITTYGIFECHACVNELFSMTSVLGAIPGQKISGKTPVERVIKRLEEIANGEYGCPLRCFFDSVSTNPGNVISSLLTLGLTCYAALNPTFGAIGLNGVQNNKPSWKTIYPPFRFFEMCTAVRKLGLFHGVKASEYPSHDEMVDYLKDLSECSRLPIGGAPGTRDFSRTMVQNEASTLPYLCKMRQWFWSESSSKLPLVVDFGRYTSNEYLERYFPDIAKRINDSNATLVVSHHGMLGNYEPPLQWTADGELLIIGEDKEGARQLMDAAAQECCVEDLLYDTGPMRFEGYPSVGQEAVDLRQRALESLRDRLGTELIH